MFLHRLSKTKAPEFPGKLTWLQGDAQTLKSLRGKVALVHFWTYSCANCLRTIPALNRWQKLYAPLGLVIIGVHTPEFSFERESHHVEQAIHDQHITFPVVLDADYKLWSAYANQYWPRDYVVNKDGYIVYDHIGEGGYADTELAIQKGLKELGVSKFPLIPPDDVIAGKIYYYTTPEMYLGFLRGKLGNAESYLPDTEEVFADVAKHEDDIPYVYGHWTVKAECIEHTRTLPTANEYLAIRYSGFGVNVVMGATKDRTAILEIELDGLPVPKDLAGDDVRISRDGRSTITLKEPRLYNVVNASLYHRGTLKLKTASGNVRLFAFTFTGNQEV